jgi:hypothetical protein
LSPPGFGFQTFHGAPFAETVAPEIKTLFGGPMVLSFATSYEPAKTETSKILSRIAQTANQSDEEEPAPSSEVISQVSTLVREASSLMKTPMKTGTVSTFYGEVNVTWRNGNEIVRIACFPNRSAIVQSGNLSRPLGSYQSHSSPPAQALAARLDALATASAS